MHLNWCKYFEHRTLRWQLEIDRTLKGEGSAFTLHAFTTYQLAGLCKLSPLTTYQLGNVGQFSRYSRGQGCCTLYYPEDASVQETLFMVMLISKDRTTQSMIMEHLPRVLIKRDLECVQAIIVFLMFSSSNSSNIVKITIQISFLFSLLRGTGARIGKWIRVTLKLRMTWVIMIKKKNTNILKTIFC